MGETCRGEDLPCTFGNRWILNRPHRKWEAEQRGIPVGEHPSVRQRADQDETVSAFGVGCQIVSHDVDATRSIVSVPLSGRGGT
jgi:hypothetical protein